MLIKTKNKNQKTSGVLPSYFNLTIASILLSKIVPVIFIERAYLQFLIHAFINHY